MKSYARLLLIALTVFVVFIQFPTLENAYSSDSDDLYSYIALTSPVTHSVKHIVRNQDANGNYLNTWAVSTSNQVYSYFVDSRGYYTFQRQQTTNLPETNSKYFERYIWDSKTNPSASTWLYLDYSSLNGDIYPSQSNSTNCTQNPLLTHGCDYVKSAGLQWLPNVTALPSQGTNQSPALQIWDSSTIGTGEGDYYFQGGIHRVLTNSRFYGQVWKRNNWNNAIFKSYADAINTADAYGWADPGISNDSQITLSPKYVYIIRQYSGCEILLSSTPWHACEIFEDHIYAKDANNNQLAEIMVVVGFTPKHHNWYQTVGDIFAVFHVMIAKN